MNHLLRTSLLGLLALPLAAQSQGFSVTAGVLDGFESYKKATNATTGFLAGVDWTAHLFTSADVPARVGLAISLMPGKDNYGLKTSFTMTQLHGDILLPWKDSGVPAGSPLSLPSRGRGRSVFSEEQL